MNLIHQHHITITTESMAQAIETIIESAGRTCWKSEDKITNDSRIAFIERIKGLHHDSVLEHGTFTVRLITDRATTHQLVRHRLCSYSQESQRYCNYSKDKFKNEITFIKPYGYDSMPCDTKARIEELLTSIENEYFALITSGMKPEDARSILPNCTKTEIVISANPRQWRHIFTERLAPAAQPQIRELFTGVLTDFKKLSHPLFGDINPN